MKTRPRSAAEAGPGGGWTRFHPLTPLLKTWVVFAAVLAAAANVLFDLVPSLRDKLVPSLRDELQGDGQQDSIDPATWAPPVLWIGAAVAGVLGLAFAFSWASWHRARFRVTDDSVQLATGIVFRQRRHILLDRVQAVDVVRPLVPRLFSLVKLKVESAGGFGSAVELAYLKQPDAVHWRRVILSRAVGARQEAPEAPPATAPAQPAPAQAAPAQPADSATAPAQATLVGEAAAAPQPAPAMVPLKSTETQLGELLGDPDANVPELFAIPTARVIGSLALSLGLGLVLPLAALALVIYLASDGEFAFAILLPAVLGLGPAVWNRLVSDFGFSAKLTERGLTISHGLTTRTSQTIPPGHILALSLTQGPLWRGLGWWRVRMNVAGYGLEVGTAVRTLLVPVAGVETVRRAIWAVAPGLAQPGAWEAVAAAMVQSGPTPGFVSAPKRSRRLDPLRWRRNAYTSTDEALVLRAGGLLWRFVVIVPHGRIQAVELRQGPLERRLRLADVQFHSALGPVEAALTHLDAQDASRLARVETARLLAAMDAALTAPSPDAGATGASHRPR
ncbi:MAG: PH domain-containing protein [Bifidobacteriaceae bacterium]|nr:PH domain-containing protein [Bifidobacteriaceae bacterium]